MARSPNDPTKPTETPQEQAGLASELTELRRQVTMLAGEFRTLLKEGVDMGTERAKAVGRQGRDVAAEKLSGVRAEVEDYARDKPVQALGMAVAAGFLLGLFMSRR